MQFGIFFSPGHLDAGEIISYMIDPQGLWSPEWVPPRGTGMAFYTQDACQSLAEVCEGMGCRGAPAANILSSGEMGPQPGEGAWEGH